ncbi:MAG: helix-turn-helix transcriptional regulator [Cyanobacteria bacterium SZAS LIN-2]|nr:helix-turn-helix transcriptional regulator [Cyanobacteria bacterium SZAS LIN-2]
MTNAELSRLTGLSKSHVSKFLHGQGQLSFRAADCIRKALHLGVEDLVTFSQPPDSRSVHYVKIPLVSHSAALFEPEIGSAAVEIWLWVSNKDLPAPGPRRFSSRQSWRRFIAVRIDHDGALSMGQPANVGAIAVIDRHYSSLRLYDPDRPNLYAIADGNHVALRYIDRIGNHLVIRPANMAFPASLIEINADTSAGQYIAGRVVIIQHRS